MTRIRSPEYCARRNERRRARYAEDSEYRQKIRDRNNARYQKPGYRELCRVAGRARARAKRLNPEAWVRQTTQTEERRGLRRYRTALLERLMRGVCEATGAALDMSQVRGPRTPHLDRINPKKGYTYKNVRWVCGVFNFAKQNWTDEDVFSVFRGDANPTARKSRAAKASNKAEEY